MVLTRSGAVYSKDTIKETKPSLPQKDGLDMLYIVALMKALYQDDSLVLEQYEEYESLTKRKKGSVLKELQFAYEINNRSKTI